MSLHFPDLAHIQIHDHVTVCLEKTGYKYKWHKLAFTQQYTTENNDLVLKCCSILHKITVRYI